MLNAKKKNDIRYQYYDDKYVIINNVVVRDYYYCTPSKMRVVLLNVKYHVVMANESICMGRNPTVNVEEWSLTQLKV